MRPRLVAPYLSRPRPPLKSMVGVHFPRALALRLAFTVAPTQAASPDLALALALLGERLLDERQNGVPAVSMRSPGYLGHYRLTARS